MGMRPEDVRENVELDDGWSPKRSFQNAVATGARSSRRQRSPLWLRLLIVLIAGLPVHMVVAKAIHELYLHLAKGGIAYFELVILISAVWFVVYLYVSAIRQRR
jgi:hypothetical protein